MSKQYYYLAASLPLIELGSPLPFRFKMLRHFLRENLTMQDMEKASVIRRYYDLKNMRALWTGGTLSQYGNFSPIELEEGLTIKSIFPEYVIDFLSHYRENSERILHFPHLLKEYFENEIAGANGFIKKYLEFEKGWRLVLSAFRARFSGRDLMQELRYENPNDPLVMQLLLLKEGKSFEPPEEFHQLKPLFELHANAPFELHQALCEFRFKTVEELVGPDAFSIDRICGFLAQFIIAERFLDLDKHKGVRFIHSFTKEAS